MHIAVKEDVKKMKVRCDIVLTITEPTNYDHVHFLTSYDLWDRHLQSNT